MAVEFNPAAFEAGQDILEHFGVKGMHWGIRRDRSESGGSDESTAKPVMIKVRAGKRVKAKGGEGHSAHEDAVRAAAHKQKARKSSVDALSNKELQDLVSRLNLEQQYTRLIASDPASKSDFAKFMKTAQGASKTYNDVDAFLKTPAGKIVKKKFGEHAGKLAKKALGAALKAKMNAR